MGVKKLKTKVIAVGLTGVVVSGVVLNQQYEIRQLEKDLQIQQNITDQKHNYTETLIDISTLKAYDKVLVRDTNEQVWVADLFSHVLDRPLGGYTFACVGHYPYQCIPYEGNEHLLGKCDDCDEYYKNW